MHFVSKSCDFAEYFSYLWDFYSPNPSVSSLDNDSLPPELYYDQLRSNQHQYHPEYKDMWSAGIILLKLLTNGKNILKCSEDGQPVEYYYRSPWFVCLVAACNDNDNPQVVALTMLTMSL